MKNTYIVKRVRVADIEKCKTPREYFNLLLHASVKYCNGLKELDEYVGGRLHRERCGYAGTDGIYEYVAEKCGK